MPFCYSEVDGTGYYLGGYNPKRLITIYDGPFFADGNVFTNVARFDETPITQPADKLDPATTVYSSTTQPVSAGNAGNYTVIDAAIGWKQPNGFYYPPAFAFRKSAFDARSERHNVLDLYTGYWQGSLLGAPQRKPLPQMGDVTPIDFTTILNDLDGTLNGMAPAGGASSRTAGLSNNHFYDAPFSVAQCNSFGTETIPHDFVTTVVAKLAAAPSQTRPTTATDAAWGKVGGKAATPIVAVYRQLKTANPGEDCAATTTVCNGSDAGCRRGTFFLGAGIGAAPGLTMNHGRYYVDTGSASQPQGCSQAPNLGSPARFNGGETYVVYHLYATSQTAVEYQVYVGSGLGSFQAEWVRIDPHVAPGGNQMQAEWSADSLGSQSYDPATGILTVTLNNDTVKADYGFPSTTENACLPHNLCEVDGTTGCKLASEFTEVGLTGTVADVCKFWVGRTNAQSADGVYLNDCPHHGCIGFSFTLPTPFTPKSYKDLDQAGATCYPKKSPWTTGLQQIDTTCKPAPPAQGNFC